jgi:hypothetical protein
MTSFTSLDVMTVFIIFNDLVKLVKLLEVVLFECFHQITSFRLITSKQATMLLKPKGTF